MRSTLAQLLGRHAAPATLRTLTLDFRVHRLSAGQRIDPLSLLPSSRQPAVQAGYAGLFGAANY
jgi:hypothetical protein